MRYLPLTADDRGLMLAKIGVDHIDDLFANVPADALLASAPDLPSAKGELASQTADAYLGQGNYAKAIELYKLALQKGVAKTDLVNMHLGIAEAMSGDKAAAATQFAAVQTAPTKDVATLWQAWAAAGTAAPAAPAPAAPQG